MLHSQPGIALLKEILSKAKHVRLRINDWAVTAVTASPLIREDVTVATHAGLEDLAKLRNGDPCAHYRATGIEQVDEGGNGNRWIEALDARLAEYGMVERNA